MTPNDPISSLLNLGPRTDEWLAAIGIHTRADLERVGPVLAYRILRDRRVGVSPVLLYALHGALHDVHWNSLSPDVRASLRADAEESISLTFEAGRDASGDAPS